MPRFEFDKRTGQMGIAKPQKSTPQEVLAKVKRVHQARMKRIGMTDDDIRMIINKVNNGVRNIRYLVFQSDNIREREEIAYMILRELQ